MEHERPQSHLIQQISSAFSATEQHINFAESLHLVITDKEVWSWERKK